MQRDSKVDESGPGTASGFGSRRQRRLKDGILQKPTPEEFRISRRQIELEANAVYLQVIMESATESCYKRCVLNKKLNEPLTDIDAKCLKNCIKTWIEASQIVQQMIMNLQISNVKKNKNLFLKKE